jgi:hypothetical protein
VRSGSAIGASGILATTQPHADRERTKALTPNQTNFAFEGEGEREHHEETHEGENKGDSEAQDGTEERDHQSNRQRHNPPARYFRDALGEHRVSLEFLFDLSQDPLLFL